MNSIIDFFSKFLRIQWPLLVLMTLATALGIVFIRSATFMNPSPDLQLAADRQITWMGIAFVAYFLMSFIDYRIWIKYGYVLYLGAVGILIAVLAFGVEKNLSKSWLQLGPLSIQPAELCKLAFICGMGWLITSLRIHIKKIWPLFIFILVTLIPMALILKQPDLGSAMVMGPIAFFMLLAGGVRKRYLALPVLAGVAGVYFSYWVVHKAEWNGTAEDLTRCIQEGTLMSIGKIPDSEDALTMDSRKNTVPEDATVILKAYQVNRIRTTFNPDLDPQGAGWAIRQSLIAVGSGGWKGKGYMQGDQNIYGFLPQTTSHNDYIFPVIAEEWGFVGGAGIIFIQALILWLILTIGASTQDRPGSLLCAGMAGMLFTHFFINVGMTIQLVPVTGIPLPFISYGGTFLVACMAGLGLVQSVWIHRKQHTDARKAYS